MRKNDLLCTPIVSKFFKVLIVLGNVVILENNVTEIARLLTLYYNIECHNMKEVTYDEYTYSYWKI